MLGRSDDYEEALPPRPLKPEERGLLEEWLAAAGDVSSAYVSMRRGDGPALYRKIVITVDGDGEPSYLIDTPAGTDVWIVVQCRPVPDAEEFRSLRAALNSVRPVLSDEDDSKIAGRSRPTGKSP
jgi:hypothetical protein